MTGITTIMVTVLLTFRRRGGREQIIAALAEFERKLIREWTKAGMHSAKRRGVHIGRPRKLIPHQIATRVPSSMPGRTQKRTLPPCSEWMCRRCAGRFGLSLFVPTRYGTAPSEDFTHGRCAIKNYMQYQTHLPWLDFCYATS